MALTINPDVHRNIEPSQIGAPIVATAAAACALGMLGALLCGGSVGCGAGPRELAINPGPPGYPPSFFTPDLPPLQLIGATRQRLRTARANLSQAQAPQPNHVLFIEYFSSHPYVLAVHYLTSSAPDGRVERMQYELTPQILTDLGTRMALFGDLVATYGEPEARGDYEWIWRFENYRLRWRGVTLEVTRQRAAERDPGRAAAGPDAG